MAGIRDTRADRVFGAVNMGLLTVLVLLVLYPLIYVVSCSVSDPSAVGAGEVILLPKGFTLMGYRRVFQEDAILTGYGNTLLYTVVGTAINLAVTVPAGYALSRRELPFHRTIMMFFLFTMYFSGGLVPTFLLVSSLGLYNTRAVLVILGAFSTYNCIICRIHRRVLAAAGVFPDRAAAFAGALGRDGAVFRGGALELLLQCHDVHQQRGL